MELPNCFLRKDDDTNLNVGYSVCTYSQRYLLTHQARLRFQGCPLMPLYNA